MGVITSSTVISIQNEIREALKEAVDLILPYKCDICGNAADTEDRFEEYNGLYKKLYSADTELHICGQCLSSLNSLEKDLGG